MNQNFGPNAAHVLPGRITDSKSSFLKASLQRKIYSCQNSPNLKHQSGRVNVFSNATQIIPNLAVENEKHLLSLNFCAPRIQVQLSRCL